MVKSELQILAGVFRDRIASVNAFFVCRSDLTTTLYAMDNARWAISVDTLALVMATILVKIKRVKIPLRAAKTSTTLSCVINVHKRRLSLTTYLNYRT